MKRCLFIYLTVILSGQAFAASSQDDLQRYLPPDQIQWLTGDSETRYLALYQEPLQAFTRGSTLAIPDWHQHPLQSPVIKAAYQQLDESGWHSWALTPPNIPVQPHELQSTEGDSRFPEVVDESYFQPHLSALSDRLTRWQSRVSNEPGFTIYIVEGISAALMVKLFSEQPQLMPDALVVVDMYLPQYQLNRQVSRQLAQLQLPVLDVYSNNSNPWVQTQQQWRQQLMQKYQHISYRPKSLLGHDNVAQRHFISSLKGWLKHQGF